MQRDLQISANIYDIRRCLVDAHLLYSCYWTTICPSQHPGFHHFLKWQPEPTLCAVLNETKYAFPEPAFGPLLHSSLLDTHLPQVNHTTSQFYSFGKFSADLHLSTAFHSLSTECLFLAPIPIVCSTQSSASILKHFYLLNIYEELKVDLRKEAGC